MDHVGFVGCRIGRFALRALRALGFWGLGLRDRWVPFVKTGLFSGFGLPGLGWVVFIVSKIHSTKLLMPIRRFEPSGEPLMQLNRQNPKNPKPYKP